MKLFDFVYNDKYKEYGIVVLHGNELRVFRKVRNGDFIRYKFCKLSNEKVIRVANLHTFYVYYHLFYDYDNLEDNILYHNLNDTQIDELEDILSSQSRKINLLGENLCHRWCMNLKKNRKMLNKMDVKPNRCYLCYNKTDNQYFFYINYGIYRVKFPSHIFRIVTKKEYEFLEEMNEKGFATNFNQCMSQSGYPIKNLTLDISLGVYFPVHISSLYDKEELLKCPPLSNVDIIQKNELYSELKDYEYYHYCYIKNMEDIPNKILLSEAQRTHYFRKNHIIICNQDIIHHNYPFDMVKLV